tara:strand:+ start:541 stop:1236 length:696 start_codon:yes stop_codon:yes gene_type:complete
MFFVRQESNHCGLHAIQNMLKSANITRADMHRACETIHSTTGDPIHNHESFGGDWSVAAVLQALRDHGYEVERAVSTKKAQREWSVPEMETLMDDPLFRGFIVHQSMRQHFTCLRPENDDGDTRLYYVDSQSSGPIRMMTRLAMRRCLSPSYAWEAFLVRGPEPEYVTPPVSPVGAFHGVEKSSKETGFTPSESFLREWRAFAEPTNTRPTTPAGFSGSPVAAAHGAVSDT